MNIAVKESKKRVEQLSLVEDPQRVKVLILTDQKTIYSDFYFINRFVNIVKLDLSQNKLSSFPVGFTFGAFPPLRILFLHYNKFGSIRSVQIAAQSRKLEYLTLFGNPLEQTKTRHYFVNQIQSLKLMDDKIIKMEERNPQATINVAAQMPKLSFPIVTVVQSQGSTHFLSAVISELRLIRHKYLIANPIIVIQRWYRKIKSKERKQMQANQIKYEASQNKVQQIEDVLSEINPVTAEKPIQRLITEKLEIHATKQQKVLSILQMNMQFLSTLRQMSSKKVFALKSFCETQKIKYQQTGQKMLCLRVPNQEDQNDSRGQLHLILRSSQKYLLRRIGSEEAMGLRKKYHVITNLLKIKKRRQPSYFNRIIDKKCNLNTDLLLRIRNVESEYKERFVLVTQEPSVVYKQMREQYYKSLHSKKPFPFCVQEIIERSAAAISIQRMWRGYKIRKQIQNSYYKMTRNHAVWFIQRHIRNLGFYKRSNMFSQIARYSNKQANNNKMIIPMSDVTAFQMKRNQICNGINFRLPDQHFDYTFDYEQSICIRSSGKLALPSYIAKHLKVMNNPNQSDNVNILDMLFKGAKSIKYFSFSSPAPETSKVSGPVSLTSSVSKSKISLSNSIASNNKVNPNQLINCTQTVSSYAIIEYQTNEEALSRKIMAALASYRFMTNSYIRSQKFLFKLTTNSIKDISERVKNTYAIAKVHEEKQDESLRISNSITCESREKSNPFKIKYFSQNQDYTIKALAYFAVNDSLIKREQSLKIKLQNLQNASSIGNYSHRRSIHANQASAHIANISRTILTMPRNQDLSSYSNFMNYCDQQDKVKHSKFYRYYEEIDKDTNNKSLQKCQSLQPTSRKQPEQEVGPHFMTLNRTVEKSYQSEANLQSIADRLSARLKPFDRISGTWDVQNQLKKQKIENIKNVHKQKIEKNNRYKKEQLTKLRQKFNDEVETQAKILQSSKLEGALSNARRHNMVKRALTKKFQDVKAFQRDFFKRGNSSIRKDMIKFQNDRSSKSPDSESIYESMKSLQTEAMKNQLLKRGKNIFNLKTEIKQFSIAGSDIDPDLSLGAIIMQSSSKMATRKRQQQKSGDLQAKKQKVESARRAQSYKREIKKNKVVHSVFPEQFYPLKESKKLGFELPKIKK